MLIFYDCALDLNEAEKELNAYKALLDRQVEIGETELQNFFASHIQLMWLMGRVTGVDAPVKYNAESSVFSKYRTDYMITNEDNSKYSFIEFEEAKLNSIFKSRSGQTTTRFDWSNTFEHGVSQVTDWFYLLSENYGTDLMENEFQCRKINYQGVVIAGRDKSIASPEQNNRLHWRIGNTVIGSKQILFFTFDTLYEAMRDQLDIIKDLSTC
ncbi:Shedu anti-phage system protein SduA domain-containing protein [Vibrio sp. 10N.222.55.B11]|uniref:Shedu anti-phage system protein SduA domain-containing protein n=1 Tax=Vibrio sp. 10N.222.55.B11 TaxID=3229648 RepID=UPI00354B7145